MILWWLFPFQLINSKSANRIHILQLFVIFREFQHRNWICDVVSVSNKIRLAIWSKRMWVYGIEKNISVYRKFNRFVGVLSGQHEISLLISSIHMYICFRLKMRKHKVHSILSIKLNSFKRSLFKPHNIHTQKIENILRKCCRSNRSNNSHRLFVSINSMFLMCKFID